MNHFHIHPRCSICLDEQPKVRGHTDKLPTAQKLMHSHQLQASCFKAQVSVAKLFCRRSNINNEIKQSNKTINNGIQKNAELLLEVTFPDSQSLAATQVHCCQSYCADPRHYCELCQIHALKCMFKFYTILTAIFRAEKVCGKNPENLCFEITLH